MDSLRLATICLCASNNKEQNIAQAIAFIEEAAAKQAQWVLLPEVFTYHGSYDQLWDAAEEPGGALLSRLQDLAKKHQITLFAGSFAERRAQDTRGSPVYNSMYVIKNDGSIAANYKKTHLFNLVGDDAASSYREGDGYLAGDNLCVIDDLDGLRVGLAICYDLRFPGLFQKLNEADPVDVLVIPAAFTKRTGRAHWEVLLRARAIEYQCYVYAANQVGVHSPGKESFGHSMIIDPWGELLGCTKDQPGIAYAALEKDRIKHVRSILPALANRRPELY